MMKRFTQALLLITTTLLLNACGGSESERIEEITLNVSMDQGGIWQQDLELGSFAAITTPPKHGLLSFNGDRVTYQPQQRHRGSDQARIEGSRKIYTLRFTVNPVNQPPELQNTEIRVVASREINGSLTVYDQDNDILQFSIITAPATGSLTIDNNGNFQYLVDDLILPNAIFTVSISDGINPAVVEQVLLLPAYQSNAEKAAYYYFSSASHLSASERRLASINSTLDTENAFSKVAEGYVAASLDDEVDRILTNKIQSQAQKAYSLADVSNAYNARNEINKAAQLRQQALDTHIQYVLDNGIENMVSDDGRYYLGLLRDALAAGDQTLANRIINQLNVYIDTLAGGIYKNALGFIAQTARTNAVELVTTFLQTGNNSLYLQAVENIDIMARAAAASGFQQLTNRPTHYRLAPLYYSWAAEQYFYIGEIVKAKQALAATLAYYGPVNYDPAYVLEAKGFAANTLAQYRAPLTEASALFSALYPQLTNYPQGILAQYGSTNEQNSAQRSVEAMQFFLRVLNDGTGNNAVQAVLADMATAYGDNPRTLLSEIVESSEQFPKIAALLWRNNRKEEARVAYQYALDLVSSEAYSVQNATNATFYTGTSGCFRIVNRILGLNAQAFAQQAAQQCAALLNNVNVNQYANLSNIIKMQLSVGQPQLAEPLFARAAAAITDELTTDLSQANAWFDLARLAAYAKNYNLISDYVDNGISSLAKAPRTTVTDFKAVLTALEKLTAISTNSSAPEPARALLTELRSHAYNDSNYRTLLAHIQNHVVSTLNTLDSELRSRPAADHTELVTNLVRGLAYARRYSQAEQLLNALSIGTAERFSNLAQISELQALQNDFPASPIATVDTDQDGKANFFAIAATPGQLAATDIELDTDADGDGVADDEDPQPLGSL